MILNKQVAEQILEIVVTIVVVLDDAVRAVHLSGSVLARHWKSNRAGSLGRACHAECAVQGHSELFLDIVWIVLIVVAAGFGVDNPREARRAKSDEKDGL